MFLAVFFVLVVALIGLYYVYGQASAQVAVSPTPRSTPTPFLATSTPVPTPTPTLTATPTSVAESLACTSAQEGLCVRADYRCHNGLLRKDCIKCGCPSGETCQDTFSGWECVKGTSG